MMNTMDMTEQLSSFDEASRKKALEVLFDQADGFPAEGRKLNMHLHTFFSYNGEGWSPSRVAWEAKTRALYSAAVCDFDVLTGCDEFREASDLLQLRGAVGMETRAFFRDYADVEINSPGEPGVYYFMGMGFVQPPAPESQAGRILQNLHDRAQQRNREVIERINAKLDGLQLSYENDVLPLTPAGNATERHIVSAYAKKALETHGQDRRAAANFWSRVADVSVEEVLKLFADDNALADWLRARLIKRGGLGYIQPTEETFPDLDEVITMVRQSRAIPMSAWLDGTSDGESNPREQLECLRAKGVAAVNIIPDRNWNIADPDARERKVQELNRYIRATAEFNMPVNVGTELNKPGQRFVDDFEAEPMKPHFPVFLEGARIMVGHTRLLRYADFGYIDEATAGEFPDPAERNRFFARVGALPVPPLKLREKLAAIEPHRAYALIADSAAKEQWMQP